MAAGRDSFVGAVIQEMLGAPLAAGCEDLRPS
jgi:hypothetical protein